MIVTEMLYVIILLEIGLVLVIKVLVEMAKFVKMLTSAKELLLFVLYMQNVIIHLEVFFVIVLMDLQLQVKVL